MEPIQKLLWHCFLEIQNQKASKSHVYLCVKEQVIYIFWNFFLSLSFFFRTYFIFSYLYVGAYRGQTPWGSSIEGCELLMWVSC